MIIIRQSPSGFGFGIDVDSWIKFDPEGKWHHLMIKRERKEVDDGISCKIVTTSNAWIDGKPVPISETGGEDDDNKDQTSSESV